MDFLGHVHTFWTTTIILKLHCNVLEHSKKTFWKERNANLLRNSFSPWAIAIFRWWTQSIWGQENNHRTHKIRKKGEDEIIGKWRRVKRRGKNEKWEKRKFTSFYYIICNNISRDGRSLWNLLSIDIYSIVLVKGVNYWKHISKIAQIQTRGHVSRTNEFWLWKNQKHEWL